jgi:hypothetical protein
MKNCEQYSCLDGGSYLELEAGHVFLIKNRGGYGGQVLDFLRIENGTVDAGLFTQDVLHVLARRIEWQGEHATSQFEDIRQEARDHILAAIKAYERFTLARKDVGDVLLGHTPEELK